MDKKRNYALEERLLQKHLVPQFPKGLTPSYGERSAFKAGMDAAEELYRPLLEAVEFYAQPVVPDTESVFAKSAMDFGECVGRWEPLLDLGNKARAALESLRKAGE